VARLATEYERTIGYSSRPTALYVENGEGGAAASDRAVFLGGRGIPYATGASWEFLCTV